MQLANTASYLRSDSVTVVTYVAVMQNKELQDRPPEQQEEAHAGLRIYQLTNLNL